MDGWAGPALALCMGYMLGSIPFGVVVARLGGAADPRLIGSGNIGATNVLRTGRKGLAAITLLMDGAKGAVAVGLATWMMPGFEPLAAAGAFLGHLFPAWLHFRGGKGVATLLGIALALHWQTGLVALVAWVAATLATRTSSVGGMCAAVACPVAAAGWSRADLALLFLGLALFVLWRHRANIARLLDGVEPQIGRRGLS